MTLATALMAAAAPATAPARLEVQVGGPGYREAFDRAQRYEGENASDMYRKFELYPAVLNDMKALLGSCGGLGSAGTRTLTVVLSFDADVGGAVLYLDKDSPRGWCVANGLAGLKYPKPPHPDFAEEIRFEFDPQ
jgi:hypothetical protein